VLPDPGIAPFHAEIRQDQGFYYLSDVSSQGDTGGVSVNDERVAARFQLRPNDRVRVGAVEMLLVVILLALIGWAIMALAKWAGNKTHH